MGTGIERSVILHGRAEEVARIALVLDGLPAGGGESLLLVGEPGIGKSALLHHAHQQAQRRAGPPLVLCGQGVESETGVPYASLHRLLSPVSGQVATLLDDRRGAVLADALQLQPDGQADRPSVAMAVLHLLQRIAVARPVVLAIDDLQWFDDESRHVVAFLIGRMAGAPVALVCASRYDAVALGLPDVPVLKLTGLGGDAIGDLVAAQAGVDPPRRVVDAMLAGTAGNPRALLELAELLTPQHIGGIARLPDPLPLGKATDWVFSAPIRRLPAATRLLLLLAAADPGLTARNLSRSAAAVHENIESLVAAEEAGLISLDASGVSFNHPLTRAAAYQCARSSQRREAHELLARICPERALNHRAAAALEPDEALAADLTEAAARARTELGHRSAADHMLRAAELTPSGPQRIQRFILAARDTWRGGDPILASAVLDGVGHSADHADTGPDRVELEILRAEIGLRRGHLVEVFESMLATAIRLGPDHTDQAARALILAGLAAWYAGDLRRFAKAAHRAEALDAATAASLPAETRVGLDYLSGIAAGLSGRDADAPEPLRRAVETAQLIDEPDMLLVAARCAIARSDESLVHALAARALYAARSTNANAVIAHAIEILAHVECWTGRFPFTPPHLLEGVRLARETDQPNTEANLLAIHGMVAAINGSTDDCQRVAREAIALARVNGGGLAIALATWALGLLDLVYGRFSAAYRRLGSLYLAGPGGGHPIIGLYATPYYVEAATGFGAIDEARRALATYDRWAEGLNRPGQLALAARCHALLAEGPAKEEHFHRSLDQHTRSGREFERGYTELLFARHLRRAGRRADAREHLESALEMFDRLELQLWITRVRADLRATGERRADTQTETPSAQVIAASGLTAQQLQIARHIAHGATNREAAEQMFISIRTVDYHLRNIYSRLGIRSRNELIRMFG